jgi:hypothetical protein
MLKRFKMLLVSISLMGLFMISLADYAKAGAGPTTIDECVDNIKDFCYFAQYNDCLDGCKNSNSRKLFGKCLQACNIEATCCFDIRLFLSCDVGNSQLPPICEAP